MRQILAPLLLFASAAYAADGAAPLKHDMLTIEQLEDAEYVKSWLMQKNRKIDQKSIDYLNKTAKEKERIGYWDAAAKTYGESALLYPSPEAILNRANAWYKMLKRIRERDKELEQNKFDDMSRLLKYYRSAAAADSVLNTLSDPQKAEVQTNIECLEKYTTTKQFQPNCEVLTAYGITK